MADDKDLAKDITVIMQLIPSQTELSSMTDPCPMGSNSAASIRPHYALVGHRAPGEAPVFALWGGAGQTPDPRAMVLEVTALLTSSASPYLKRQHRSWRLR
jgi:hypothetical protein